MKMPGVDGAMVVFFSGGLGAVLRYLVALGVRARWPDAGWPWPTFAVNVLGSLAIGVVMAFASRGALEGNWRLAVVTGFLGGFTTFSAFSFETFELIKDGRVAHGMAFAVLSTVTCVAATAFGYSLSRGS